jgi:hypothetical protein
MTEFIEVPIGEFLNAQSGRPKFILDYIEAHPGSYPVYSASLTEPFGYIDKFDYDGRYLTWVMNGYGGRVQEVAGRFSATRDRGVFLPRDKTKVPDLTYLRFAMERQLVAAAVGRRVDGRLNEYTKIYPQTAEEVVIALPIDSAGACDYDRMVTIGQQFRRVEERQAEVRSVADTLRRSTVSLGVAMPASTIELSDAEVFELAIGKRVLRSEQSPSGVPVYSANVLAPFGYVTKSNLSNFARPSLLWGIDGNFDWNLMSAGEEFATTDHCGRLQVLDEDIDPEYVLAYLRFTKAQYGFDRVLRASLGNMKADVAVTVPLDNRGKPSLERQRELAAEFKSREAAQRDALAALDDVLYARVTAE